MGLGFRALGCGFRSSGCEVQDLGLWLRAVELGSELQDFKIIIPVELREALFYFPLGGCPYMGPPMYINPAVLISF